MDRIVKRLILATLAALALALGCRTAQPVAEAPPQPEILEPTEANTAFGLELFERLSDENNLVISPWSITTALAMTAVGTRGETAREFTELLRLDVEQEETHRRFAELVAAMERDPDDEEELTVLSANSLWVQSGLNYGVDFLRVLEEAYRAPMRQVDFQSAPQEARENINAHISEKTRELIPELFPANSITSDTRLVLANALYFYGPWQHPFDEEHTTEMPFTRLDGSSTDVNMMRQQTRFRHLSNDELQAVEFPYDGGPLSLLVVMPQQQSPAEFAAGLSPQHLDDLVNRLQSGPVDVGLPRFELRSPITLTEVLQDLGLVLAFSPEGDFTPITRQIPLFLDAVVHEATIIVDEKGTEAAAATGTIITTDAAEPDQPTRIIFDRPFLFFLRDHETGALLFVGQLTSPQQ